MSDEIEYQGLSLVLKLHADHIATLRRRMDAIEAELAVMRGTQSASRWSGDSPPMTIEPQDNPRNAG